MTNFTHLKEIIKTSDSDEPLTCHDLGKLVEAIEDIRHLLLRSYKQDGTSPIATQFFLKALTHMELAQREMKLADYYQMREK